MSSLMGPSELLCLTLFVWLYKDNQVFPYLERRRISGDMKRSVRVQNRKTMPVATSVTALFQEGIGFIKSTVR